MSQIKLCLFFLLFFAILFCNNNNNNNNNNNSSLLFCYSHLVIDDILIFIEFRFVLILFWFFFPLSLPQSIYHLSLAARILLLLLLHLMIVYCSFVVNDDENEDNFDTYFLYVYSSYWQSVCDVLFCVLFFILILLGYYITSICYYNLIVILNY